MLGVLNFPLLVRIHLGPLVLSPHGILTAGGFVAGARLLLRDSRRWMIPDDAIYDVLMRAGIGAIVGARVVYVVNHLGSFESPLEWFQVWNGGISLLGGIAGALVVVTPVAHRRGLSFFPLMDLAAPGFALGIAIGRIGDLIIGDHLGARTGLPFGFQCPDVVDVGRTVGSPCPPGAVVHLTAAYDLIIVSFILFTLLVLRRIPLRTGERTLVLAALYGAGRFAFDFLREDTRRLGLTGSQWTAAGLIAAATILILRRRKQSGDSIIVATGLVDPSERTEPAPL